MYVVSCPCYWSIAELRTFWERWQTLCLVHFLAGLGWLVHVHGSWVTLQALWRVERTLVWLQGDAGKMNVHRADLITSSPTTVFVRTPFQLHSQLPPSSRCHSGSHQEELLLQPVSLLVLSLLPSPLPRLSAGRALAPLMGGRWNPGHWGGHRRPSLRFAVRWAIREGTG